MKKLPGTYNLHLQAVLCEENGNEIFLKVSIFLSGSLDFKHPSISHFYSSLTTLAQGLTSVWLSVTKMSLIFASPLN